MQDESALASALSHDLCQLGENPFQTPDKATSEHRQSPDQLLSPTEFIPLSQKVSFSPMLDESLSASASELLYSELTEKNELLKKAQSEAREY